jgi:hypothetical protein
MTWQIGSLLFLIQLSLVFPNRQLTCFKYLLRWLVISFGFSRNMAHHDKVIPNALNLPATINKLVLEHYSAWSTTLRPTLRYGRNFALLFIRSTMLRLSDLFCASCSFRSFSGSIIGCRSLISPPCSALYGEAHLAAQLAISLNISSFILKGDSLTVSLALQNPAITQDWRISSLISCIHDIIPSTTSWSASHINRSANLCVHHVASWASTRLHSGCILFSPSLVGPSPTCFRKASSCSFLVP